MSDSKRVSIWSYIFDRPHSSVFIAVAAGSAISVISFQQFALGIFCSQYLGLALSEAGIGQPPSRENAR